MLNLLDLWKSAQAVSALEGAGRQIGLDPGQARAAALWLTPAFLMALRQNATHSPNAFADLMRLTGTGAFAPLLEQGLQAFTPQRKAEAEDAVSRLFGPEASRLVAQQAAAMAGIAPEAVRQMMPLVTGLMFGGLFRGAAERGAPDLFGRMAEMARAAPPRPEPEPSPNPFAAMMRPWFPSPPAPAPAPERNPWEDFFGTLVGLPPRPDAPAPARSSRAPAPPPRPEPAPSLADPFGDMMRAMMGLAPPPAPEPPPPEPDPEPDAVDAWGQAIRAGQEAQKRHIEALQSIFARAWQPVARHDQDAP